MKTLQLTIITLIGMSIGSLGIAYAQNYTPILYGIQSQTPPDTHEELHKKLVNTRDGIGNMMGSKMLKIPISSIGINELNLTLDVGIDDPNVSVPSVAEKYIQEIQEIVGNLPIHVEFEHATDFPLILRSPNANT
jgi:hypothetical protein